MNRVSNQLRAGSPPTKGVVLRDARTGRNYYDVRDYGAVGDGVHDETDALQAAIQAAMEGGKKPMVYYRIAVKAITYGVYGTSIKWLFAGPAYSNRVAIHNMLHFSYTNPENMVFAGTTLERLQDHLERFIEGRYTICWSRGDFLTGVQTDEVAVRAAEDALYGTLKGVRFGEQQRETQQSTALEDQERLKFYRWMVETGRISETGTETGEEQPT